MLGQYTISNTMISHQVLKLVHSMRTLSSWVLYGNTLSNRISQWVFKNVYTVRICSTWVNNLYTPIEWVDTDPYTHWKTPRPSVFGLYTCNENNTQPLG